MGVEKGDCKALHVRGTPYVAGQPDTVTISEYNKPGIRLQIDAGEPFLLNLSTVSSNTLPGARFVSASNNISEQTVNVIEHIGSGVVLKTGFRASALISITTKKNLMSLLAGNAVFVPAMGAGVQEILQQIEGLQLESQNVPTEIRFTPEMLKENTFTRTINGRDYHIEKTEKGGLRFTQYDVKKIKDVKMKIERVITISPSEAMRATIQSSYHPDAQEVSIGTPVTVNYLEHPYDEKLLTARAMGRTASPFIYYLLHVFEKIKFFQGITDKTYFKVKPGATTEDIVRSMNPLYQEEKNEHFRHTLGPDFPFELYLLCKSLETNYILADFVFENATHDTRLDVLNLLYQLYKDNNEIFSCITNQTSS